MKKLILDTGTWLKLDRLISQKIITQSFIDILYSNYRIIITPEIEEELSYFKNTAWEKNKTYIVPIEDEMNAKRAYEDGFDAADSSIFGISNVKDMIIISEDRPLIKYSNSSLEIYHFSEFLVELNKRNLLSKDRIYNIVKHLYSIRNIGKKIHNRIKKMLYR